MLGRQNLQWLISKLPLGLKSDTMLSVCLVPPIAVGRHVSLLYIICDTFIRIRNKENPGLQNAQDSDLGKCPLRKTVLSRVAMVQV